jgi:hypothetical protein
METQLCSKDRGGILGFGDYIVYIDESGDHNLVEINEAFPVFVLAFCIFRKSIYVENICPNFQNIKFKWFGHDTVIFHEREIRKQLVPFKFLQNVSRRDEFMADVDNVITQSEFTVIASVINKARLKGKYADPGNPYEIGLQFCIERLFRFLREKDQTDRLTHCVFERRGKREDAAIELEFRRICAKGNYEGTDINCLDIQFQEKSANSCGLQISDLVARPIGIKELRASQPNRAYDIIEPKFRKSANGQIRGYGLKVFP